MSGYRRVNYYELCRLCTNSEGPKINIFLEEGRTRQLQNKIETCLSVQTQEEDSLPKVICTDCIKKLEYYVEFRQTVRNAQVMLETYFNSIRYSEDFLKEGKVYVKTTEKENVNTECLTNMSRPKEDPLAANSTSSNKIKITNVEILDQRSKLSSNSQHRPALVANANLSNLHTVTGVQARVQQFKCAMQSGNVAAAVLEATSEMRYSYQQQQQNSENQSQGQNVIEQNQPVQIQVQGQNQLTQQIQSLRQQLSQQQSNQQISQSQQQRQNQTQMEQARQVHRIDSKNVNSVSNQQTVPQQQQTNIIIKTEEPVNQTCQIIQKIQQNSYSQKTADSINSNQPNYTMVQAALPEVFLSLGLKDALQQTTDLQGNKEFKNSIKTSADSQLLRASVGQISELLRARSATGVTNHIQASPLVTVNTEAISQASSRPISCCCDCGKTFDSDDQLNAHNCNTLLTEVIEIKEDPVMPVNGSTFNCDVCNKPFKRKEHLFQHRKLHTGERPYICTTCSKAFSRKEHLVRHLVSHTGQKMHECDMCGKSFSRKDNLHKHRKTHGVSGPYICETCGKSFVVKHYYLMHLTTHVPTNTVDGSNSSVDPLPYKCDICHKAFSVKNYLTTHKLRHRPKNTNNANANASQTQHQVTEVQQSMSNANNELNNTRNAISNTSTSNENINNDANSSSIIEIQNVNSEHQNSNFSETYQGNVTNYQ